LDGKRATTYIGGAERLQKMFPKSRVEGDRHVVVDGNLVTTIGGAVSYEGSLALLERIAGPTTADRVAAALYYFRWEEKKLASATAGAGEARAAGNGPGPPPPISGKAAPATK